MVLWGSRWAEARSCWVGLDWWEESCLTDCGEEGKVQCSRVEK
jgi:hypothetical protein